MHQERIDIAARPDRKRLSGADGDDVNIDAAYRSKERQDVTE